MDNRKTGFNGIYIIYIVLSVVSYLFFQLLIVNIGAMYNLHSLTINIICGVGNGIILYVIFYRSLQKQLCLDGIVAAKKENASHSYVWAVFAGASGCLFLNNLVALTGLNRVITSYEAVADRLYEGNVVLMTIQMVVVASIVEELLFRGIVYRAADRVGGNIFAAVLSAFLFAFLHGNLLQGIYAFILGLLLAYVFKQYGSITGCILFHMGSNIISVIGTMTSFFDSMYESLGIMVIATIMAGVLLIVSIGMMPASFFNRKRRHME